MLKKIVDIFTILEIAFDATKPRVVPELWEMVQTNRRCSPACARNSGRDTKNSHFAGEIGEHPRMTQLKKCVCLLTR